MVRLGWEGAEGIAKWSSGVVLGCGRNLQVSKDNFAAMILREEGFSNILLGCICIIKYSDLIWGEAVSK